MLHGTASLDPNVDRTASEPRRLLFTSSAISLGRWARGGSLEREIERVSRSDAFITVDAYGTDQERDNLEKWVLTCKTYMHVEEWKELFAEAGYTGDYYWFIVG